MKANIARFTIALKNGLGSVGGLTKVTHSIRPLLPAIFLLTLPLAGGAFLALYLNGFFRWPDFSRIQDRREMSILYAEGGEALREYCTYCREIATLEEMGHFPTLAVLVEDKAFEKRLTPVSGRGILRALWQDLKTLSLQQGGSTITQQVARILFAEEELRREQESKAVSAKLWRKGRELWLSMLLEGHVDKKQILELYLNNVFCGHGRYGIKACSQYYFHKQPAELSIAEAAMMIGTWRAPQYSPFINPKEALKLRGRVLDQFVSEQVITKAQEEEWQKLPLPQRQERDQCRALHAAEFVRRRIVQTTRLVDQGLKVHTSINCGWQRAAAYALHESMETMKARNSALKDLWGVAILIDARTGAIKVFAQEPTFQENEYLLNQIKRHCGSACKPFFYATWILKGGRLSCQDQGSGPCQLDDSYGTADGKSALSLAMGKGRGRHRIQNFPYESLARYAGISEPIRCLAESRNACTMSAIRDVRAAVRGSRVPRLVYKEEILGLMARLGMRLPTMEPERARREGIGLITPEIAQRFGLPEHTVDPGLTVAIGSIDVSPLDMAVALAGLMGSRVEPYAIEEIEGPSGEVVYDTTPKAPENVFEKVIEAELAAKLQLEKVRNGSSSELTVEEKKKIEADAKPEAEKLVLAITRGLRAPIELAHGTGKLVTTGDPWRGIPKLDFPVMGKTGTATNEEGDTTDNWFYGCSPSYCMAVWIGREKKQSMETMIEAPSGRKVRVQETGGRNALPVFIKTMKAVYENRPTETFPEATDPKKPFLFSLPPSPSPLVIPEGEAGAPHVTEHVTKEDAVPGDRDDF
ncbi:transglycosylase domain-containing protein [Candidatus Methylomirabilis sp.]|uniref:transglycosylase domain-containing protein n=1 Tax=Candidatus Methylomirabilis sp. TaxID=2032687 RepID=UPI003C71D90F